MLRWSSLRMDAACPHLSSLSFGGVSDVLDWYDGAVSGVTSCPECGKHYGFAMLDWSQQERYRLFMLTLLTHDDVAQYKAIYQFNTGDVLSEEDYDKAKFIVRPKRPPEALVLWDSNNNKFLGLLPVPNIAYGAGWRPFENSYGDVNWFDALGVLVPETEANSGIAQGETWH